jgi:glutamate--cysteine ligase
VTGVHTSAQACVDELVAVHQVVHHALHDDLGELMWSGSMPCELPADAAIPIGQYGHSNVGQAKTVYRHGLSHRYGPRMQTISGIHYNWSFPGLGSEDYFSLIRNFRRHSFLLLLLFGASPAVPASFVAGLPHELDARDAHTAFLPYATSLRMGRLGYQSDAQSALCVSYNSLEGYACSLEGALTRPYAPYEAIGIREEDGHYKQLSTSLLQIENEFYSTIRPKRVIFQGERPLHALRERGVEYVEVRCMDLNPFLPVGIDAPTMRVLDVFLLHCLLADSPPDTPAEVAELARNQQRTAARGREPGLLLERAGQMVKLDDWAHSILTECEPIAQALDQANGTSDFSAALLQAQRALAEPSSLPSARVLEAMNDVHGGRYTDFALAQSAQSQADLLALPLDPARAAELDAMAAESVAQQARIEASDSLLFEAYRQAYLSPSRLGRKGC